MPLHASLKSVTKAGLGYALARLGLLDRIHRGRVLVLTYHRILPAPRLHDFAVEPGMYVTDITFRTHLVFLTAHYEVLSMRDWLDSWSGRSLSPRGRYCLLTFDDGWRDNYDCAFPILRESRIPVTIFLATRFVGTREWFWTERLTFLLMRCDPRRLATATTGSGQATSDMWQEVRACLAQCASGPDPAQRAARVSDLVQRLKAYPRESLERLSRELARRLQLAPPCDPICLSWEQVREMSAAGIAFASHSHSHDLLTQVPPSIVREDLEASARAFEANGVPATPVFCYPNGSFDPEVQSAVRDAGYAAAVSTLFGTDSLVPTDRFAIPRIAVHEDITRTGSLLALRLISASSRRAP